MRTAKLLWVCAVVTVVAGCKDSKTPPPATQGAGKPQATQTVLMYTSVDEPVARPIIDAFTQKTGIQVQMRTDAEAMKTTGLVQRLRAEKANPQCDVFWNNEVFHTINLANEGVLGVYESPAARDIPAQFKDPQHRWAACGLRVRTIARASGRTDINTVEDLLKPELKGKITMARPWFGTATGQVASWLAKWGNARTEKFLRDLKANGLTLVPGNSDVVRDVSNGRFIAGLTDNDDVDSMLAEGGKLTGVPAKLADDGALAMPCTVSLVAGRPENESARALANYLLSPEVEQKMIAAKYAARSVRQSQVGVDVMKVNYADVAAQVPRAMELTRRIFEKE